MLLCYPSALNPCQEILPDSLVSKREHTLFLKQSMLKLKQKTNVSAMKAVKEVPEYSSLRFALYTEANFH